MGWGHEIYGFPSPYLANASYQILVKIGPVVFTKMLTHAARKPIAIGHTGDLITSLQAVIVTQVSKNMHKPARMLYIFTPPINFNNEVMIDCIILFFFFEI